MTVVTENRLRVPATIEPIVTIVLNPLVGEDSGRLDVRVVCGKPGVPITAVVVHRAAER